MDTLYQIVQSASEYADTFERKKRTTYSILSSVTAEVGELAEEVAIKNGDSYKTEGVDGVVGEAVDVIIAALDLIWVADPTLTEYQISEIAKAKCAKWISKIV